MVKVKKAAKKIVKAAATGSREISLAAVWRHGSPALVARVMKKAGLHNARSRPAGRIRLVA